MSKTTAMTVASFLVVCICLCSLGLAAEEWKPSKEYFEKHSRIQNLAQATGLSASEKKNRLSELNALCQKIKLEWQGRQDPEGRARLMLDIAGAMGSMDVLDPQRLYLAQECATNALDVANDIPIDVECSLLNSVQYLVDATGKELVDEQRAASRKKMAALWLHAWQRIDRAIDERWDSQDRPALNVSPPDGSPAGASPETIRDPALRAKYLADIEANRQKIKYADLQLQLRSLQKHWLPGAKRLLIRSYMEAPDRAEELQGLLKQYVSDAAEREQILDAVKNKKMPEELIVRNTTQPAQTQPAQ